MDRLYDMHCHIGFTPDPADTARAAASAGISAFSCTVTPQEFERVAPLLAFAPTIVVGLGAHPWWIADGRMGESDLDRFCELARTTRSIGEIGLDFAGPRDTKECRRVQTAALERILAACEISRNEEGTKAAASEGTRKLISLHAVRSAQTVLDCLVQAHTLDHHRCILHWFSGTSDELNRALDLGCFFSVGPRMIASRRGREYVRRIPLDRLLLETDMPSRAGDCLPAPAWCAELGNALSGISQLKHLSREETAERLAASSTTLLA